jgi:methyl-accepting chemotaxis protein
MGLFDALDKLMDDIENGAIEKRVNHLLDKVEGTGSQALDKVEKLAENSEKVVENAGKLVDKADRTVDRIQKKAG